MPAAIACGADTTANTLFTSLTADFPVPPSVDLSSGIYSFTPDTSSELYQTPEVITIDQLTEVDLEGDGVFDKLMRSVDLHIQREFKDNRITGDQYAKVYTEVIQSVLSQASQFVLSKDQARWSAITAQMQARITEVQATQALIELERVKTETQKTIFEMQKSGAEFALTKMNVAKADAEYCLVQANTSQVQYMVDSMLPQELAQNVAQTALITSQKAVQDYQVSTMMPTENALREYELTYLYPSKLALEGEQLSMLQAQTSKEEYTVTNLMPAELGLQQFQLNSMLPQELLNLIEQAKLVTAQTNSENYKAEYLLPAELAIQEYQRMEVLPSSVAINHVQADRVLPAEAAIKEFMNANIQPIERDIQAYQLSTTLPLKTSLDQYQLTNLLPVSLGQEQHKLNFQLPAQTTLIKEQAEAQRAQTLDNRSDGITPVSGVIGTDKTKTLAEIERSEKEMELIDQEILVKQIEVTERQFNYDYTLPAQLDLIQEQAEVQRAQTLDTRTDGVTTVAGVIGKNKESIDQDIASKVFNVDFVLPVQLDLVKEQRESERAKTLNTRTDAAPVTGSIGKQKDLYDQQIDSFVKDAQHKTAKMYLDGWITQKTLDEGLTAPTQLTNTNIDAVIAAMRTANSL